MEKITKYKCSYCGLLFETPDSAHELRHEQIARANRMFKNGNTLKQIQDRCGIWDTVPQILEKINKDNLFKFNRFQNCDKSFYQINCICFDGKFNFVIVENK